MCQVWGAGEVHTGVWWGDVTVKDHLKDLGVDGRIILQWIFMKWDGETWAGLIWIKIGTDGGRL
jgi:hypothetical protein